ncbi:hypothetical protein, partial [Pseudomonas brassicacearum]|uniref:hypothetical protein n=1 Tax=Pseudomonas brassicacearum TaxID=930166 RepID=UPI001C83D404
MQGSAASLKATAAKIGQASLTADITHYARRICHQITISAWRTLPTTRPESAAHADAIHQV